MAATCRPCAVEGLYSLVDLQKLCSVDNVKLSQEANDEILFTILKIMGPKLATKAIHKLIDNGHLGKESNEYEVERILDKRYCKERGRDLFLVKWKHWPHQFNTWEPRDNLSDCPELITNFEKKLEDNSDCAVKRKHADLDPSSSGSEDDAVDDTRRQLQLLFQKLRNGESGMTPLQIIIQSGIADNLEDKVKRKIQWTASHRTTTAWATKKNTKLYQEHKKSQAETLKAWEKRFNAVYKNCQPVTVQNNVDLDAPPENFQFISDYIPMPGLSINSEAVMGCSCKVRCCAASKECCPHSNDADFAYTSAKRVRLMPGSAIYECNDRCTCSSDCWNRVVQLGSQVKLAIFKTKNGCGWGVKAMQRIIKGTFVMEYLGEIISNEEAENRGKVYDAELFTYLFDLDFDGDDCQFTIDARNYGNIAHFVNHSCDPNMSVYGVWINNLDVRLPRIALFANRDIRRGEEVSFDYKMTGDTSDDPHNLSGMGSRTPSKMSPFKSSPFRAGGFRRPSVSPGFHRPPRSAMVTGEGPTMSSIASESNTYSDRSSGKTVAPHGAKANLLSELNASSMNSTSSSISVQHTELNGEISEESATPSASDSIITTESMTKLKKKDGEVSLHQDTDLPTELPDMDASSALLDGPSSPVPLADSSLIEASSGMPESSSPVKSASKPDFSCKDYRIVCHCGAKNCRKFLF